MSGTRGARSPLSIADEVFTTLGRGPEPLSLHPRDLLGEDAPSYGPEWRSGPIPLAVLRDRMRRADTPLRVKTRAWSLLVTKAQQEGGVWTVAAVGVALPRLVRLATELAGGDHDGRAELDAEVLAGFLEALARANPASVQLFPHLLRQARRGGLAWLRHQRAADTPLADTGHHSTTPTRPWGHPDLVLAAAVAAGVITTAEAALIGATRLEDHTVSSLAAGARLGEATVLKRRQRAERRLTGYLLDQLSHTNPDDTPRPAPAHPATRASRSANPARSCTARRSGCPKTPAQGPSYPRGTVPTHTPRAQRCNASQDRGPRHGHDETGR